MPSLIDIRRRIRAVKSTQQITKAMKMVAASRLRRAQERALAVRPYSTRMLHVLQGVAARVDPSTHPLLQERDEQREGARILLVLMTADKGFCGSFNTNLIKAAAGFITDRARQNVTLALVGRKGRDFFGRRGFEVAYERVNFLAHVTYADAESIARASMDEFQSLRADGVYLVYNEFKSVLQQRLSVERILPIPRIDLDEADPAARVDYLYEPSAERILCDLLPRFVEMRLHHALLETSAAENAARMVAMDNATKNAAEMIDNLTLYMNKVRQAGITREIIEVVSGAAAL